MVMLHNRWTNFGGDHTFCIDAGLYDLVVAFPCFKPTLWQVLSSLLLVYLHYIALLLFVPLFRNVAEVGNQKKKKRKRWLQSSHPTRSQTEYRPEEWQKMTSHSISWASITSVLNLKSAKSYRKWTVERPCNLVWHATRQPVVCNKPTVKYVPWNFT